MKIITVKNYEEMSEKAADIIFAQVLMKPESVLGLATGGTPVGIYRLLVDYFRSGRIDFSEVTTINLDEYQGLSHDDRHSYRHFMQEHFIESVNMRPENAHIPDGANLDAREACAEYDAVIKRTGGIDMQLLGLGLDGHIGFNEPSDFFPVNTHCVKLAKSTIEANKCYFNDIDEVPKCAYTMGIGGIMQARKILMVVSGEKKADIVRKVLYGLVIPQVPASILQLHSDVTVILDEAAASEIVM